MTFSSGRSLRGVRIRPRGRTAEAEAARLIIPAGGTVTLPMSMHIGRPAKPVVRVGDRVCVGALVAEQDGRVSSPVHASVSGKVAKIRDVLLSNGATAPAVVLESDGLMTPDPSLVPPDVRSREDLIEAIRASGLVGLGGAGFPTYIKYDADPDSVDTLIINGAECEPYITSDSLTMRSRADDIAYAIETISRFLTISRVVIGVEDHKKREIACMRALAERDPRLSVQVLPSVYPQGAEKVLVYRATGRVVGAGKLPLDVGCIVSNCTTVAVIGRMLRTGMPLVEKCVTVDGGAVRNPMNVTAPIGASLSALFDFCGGFTEAPARILYGGPMMGIAVPDADAPVLKNTNAALALTERETRTPPTTACIRCGACVSHCPFGLNAAAVARAYERGDTRETERLGVSLCMECGTCGYVCPANRPLVQTMKLAKTALREAQAREKEKAKAKEATA